MIGREGDDSPILLSLIYFYALTTAGGMRGTKISKMLRNAAGGCFRNEEFPPKESNWTDLRRSERMRRESRICCPKPDSQRKKNNLRGNKKGWHVPNCINPISLC